MDTDNTLVIGLLVNDRTQISWLVTVRFDKCPPQHEHQDILDKYAIHYGFDTRNLVSLWLPTVQDPRKDA